MREHGLLALTVRPEFGGVGASLENVARVVREVAHAEPATALVLTMQYCFHSGINQNPRWSLRLRELVQRDAAENGALINALRGEPELGSPATIARRVPEGWSVSGHKIYSTGIPILKWLGVWGHTDEAEPRTGFFLIPRSAAGIRVVETWGSLGPARQRQP